MDKLLEGEAVGLTPAMCERVGMPIDNVHLTGKGTHSVWAEGERGDKVTARYCKEIALCREYGIDGDLTEQMKRIKYRDERQIRAASKIMDACTGYVRLREIVHPSGRQLIDSIGQFIDEHLSEEISVARLCEEFYISRTRLYELVGRHVDGGIAAFVRQRRLERAKALILDGNLSIPAVADAVGFSDYNYFLRVFKQTFGMSPRRLANGGNEE